MGRVGAPDICLARRDRGSGGGGVSKRAAAGSAVSIADDGQGVAIADDLVKRRRLARDRQVDLLAALGARRDDRRADRSAGKLDRALDVARGAIDELHVTALIADHEV